MTELEQLVYQYQTTSDEEDKADLISVEFEFLDDYRKWEFLLPLLKEEQVYDLIKVNIYKIIEVADFNGLDLIVIKDDILACLKAEQDELVREYGFIALTWNFSNFPDVIDFCVETLANEQEEENIRHCAFSVITKSKDLKKVHSLRDQLLNIKGFSKYVARFFNELDNAGQSR